MPTFRRKIIKPKARPQWFYGWVIVAVCSFTLVATFGTRLSFTVFFVALIEEFGWSRASTSLIFSVSMAVFALTSIFAGMALDRWGVRPVFGVGAGAMAVGLLLSSRIQSLAQLVFAYGVVVGIGISILGLGLQASLVSRWFKRRRGTAIGLTFAGTGLGTLILTPGVEYVISTAGWRNAYLVLAGLALALVPVILLFLRSEPSELGQHPDGDSTPWTDTKDVERPQHDNWIISQAIRTPGFWLLIVASLTAIGPLRMLTVHQLAVATAAGFDRLYAASMIGFSGAVTAASFILFGALSDRIGRRVAYVIGSACLLAAVVALSAMETGARPGLLLLYAILLGLGEGSRSSLVTAVASDLFPGKALGTISGAVGSAFGAGAAVMPWLAGRIFDIYGNYTIAFLTAGITITISAITLWIAPSYAYRKS